jgi:GH43 family beta-xylosidase
MGILEFVGEDMLDPDHWVKHPEPFMTKGNGCVGPGHATFFESPDGGEVWICHHCLKDTDPECKPMQRHCHVQKVFFDETGFPHADNPLPKGIGYKEPKK